MAHREFRFVLPAFLAACLILGGSSAAGIAGNLFLQVTGAALIGMALWRGAADNPNRIGLAAFFIMFGVTMLLQFVPLPPALWSIIPGRVPVIEGYELAGVSPPWLGLSLDPWNSLHSLVWWIPALAVFVIARTRTDGGEAAIVWTIAAVAYASVALAVVQSVSLAGYLYGVTNIGNGVGFYANSNHFGSFMLMAMALLSGERIQARASRRRARRSMSLGLELALLLAPLAVGVYLSKSLACGLLTIPLIAGILVMGGTLSASKWRLVLGLLVVGMIAMIAFLYTGTISNDLLAKSGTPGISRNEFLKNGLAMARDFAPFGSGLGTFPLIYPWYENPAQVGGTFVNHAHNDLVEILAELGVFGLALIGVFLAWLGRTAKTAWLSIMPSPLAQAATLAIVLVLAHSLVDYPLRTAASSALLALCCVIAVRSQHARTVVAAKVDANRSEPTFEV